MKVNIVNNGIVKIPFNENLPTIEITNEEYQKIMNGELKVFEGKLVDNSQALINAKREFEIQQRLTELTKDFAQVEAGLVIEDLEERKAEFRTLLNEVRVLQGKEPREIKE